MIQLKDISDSIFHLFFPHVCSGCGSDVLSKDGVLCLRCINDLPITNFHLHSANPIEKIFWGRLPVTSATSLFYFTKGSLMQELMHQFKYNGNKELGWQLGRLMGTYITNAKRFQDVQGLVPLPLFPAKERKRGYNQAAIICEGMAETTGIPVLKDIVSKVQHTDTQTKKNRIERWQNMEGRFELHHQDPINRKHLLLIDDVITTGATLEACGRELLRASDVKVSVATLCYAFR